MSFEKILYKLRDAWRGDIKQSLEGLPGYYWGEVTGPGEALLDAAAPGSAPVPVDDLVGTLVGDRVLLVLVDGAFSVVGVADRPRDGVPRFATTAARDAAFPAPVDGQACYVTGVGYYVRDGGVWRAVLGDTGWQRLTPASGFTNATDSTEAQYRVAGIFVCLRGTLTKDSGTIGGGETVATVPAAYAPDRYTGFPLVTLTPANGFRGRVNADGQVGTQTGTTLGATITLDGAYWLLP